MDYENDRETMTDKEIIQGLIARDECMTRDFFFMSCQPLFKIIIKQVFSYEVDYEEVVNELYVYLMENDAAKLKGFQYRSSVFQWLKVVAIRFFINKRDNLTHVKFSDSRRDCADLRSARDLYRSHLFSLLP